MLVSKLEGVVRDLEGAAGLVGGGAGGNGEMLGAKMIGRDEIRELEGW